MSEDDESTAPGVEPREGAPEHPAAIAGGRFECNERVDRGGLGTVWRGTDRETGAPVAIKRDHDEVNDGEQVRASFRQELRWFRRLSGGPVPGSLVYFVDGGVDAEDYYVVTELLEAGSVAEYFAADRTPGVEALRTVAPRICEAVAFLHRNGVVHADVKPGNVLGRRRGDAPGGSVTAPVLIDFNSAVSAEDGTDTLFHHDPYKPPELTPTDLREEPVGPRSDVYALGKLCCFLLAGETPAFEAGSIADWTAVDPREDGADCDASLARVVERATAPRPDERHPDAAALSDALAAELGRPERSAVLVDERSGQQVRVRPGDAIGRWTADQRVPHVVLPDPERLLSPVHASLEWNGADWVLVDRSLNGTYVHAGWVSASDVQAADPEEGAESTGAAAGIGDESGGPADAGGESADWWHYTLSAAGRERRVDQGASLPVEAPPETIVLGSGTRIAPVDPDAGWELRFEPE